MEEERVSVRCAATVHIHLFGEAPRSCDRVSGGLEVTADGVRERVELEFPGYYGATLVSTYREALREFCKAFLEADAEADRLHRRIVRAHAVIERGESGFMPSDVHA